jgi:hypothetical protein
MLTRTGQQRHAPEPCVRATNGSCQVARDYSNITRADISCSCDKKFSEHSPRRYAGGLVWDIKRSALHIGALARQLAKHQNDLARSPHLYSSARPADDAVPHPVTFARSFPSWGTAPLRGAGVSDGLAEVQDGARACRPGLPGQRSCVAPNRAQARGRPQDRPLGHFQPRRLHPLV